MQHERWMPYLDAEGVGTAGGAGTAPAASGGDPAADPAKTEPAKPTFDELAQDDAYKGALEAYAQTAIDKARQAWDAEKAEAERVAKLTTEERAKEDAEKLTRDRADFERQRLEYEAAKQLETARLPVTFAPLMLGKDAKATADNISAFQAAFTAAVDAAVTERIKGTAPKAGTPAGAIDGVTAAFLAKNPGLKV